MYPPKALAPILLALSLAACSSERRDSRSGEANVAAVAAPASAPASVGVDSMGMPQTSVRVGEGEGSGVASERSGPNFTEGKSGEVWMATQSGSLIMRLRHDSVLIGFSDSLRQAVKSQVDTSMRRDADEERSGLARAVRGAVEATVKTTLREVFDKERGFPVSDVRSVRYEGGEIVFDYEHKPLIAPEGIKDGDRSMLTRFHPADAARFVGALRGRMGAR